MRLDIVRHADPDYDTGHITETGQLEAAALSRWFVTVGLTRGILGNLD